MANISSITANLQFYKDDECMDISFKDELTQGFKTAFEQWSYDGLGTVGTEGVANFCGRWSLHGLLEWKDILKPIGEEIAKLGADYMRGAYVDTDYSMDFISTGLFVIDNEGHAYIDEEYTYTFAKYAEANGVEACPPKTNDDDKDFDTFMDWMGRVEDCAIKNEVLSD